MHHDASGFMPQKKIDAELAGGKYFRDERQLRKLMSGYFEIKENGKFSVNRSFYSYAYVVAQRQR